MTLAAETVDETASTVSIPIGESKMVTWGQESYIIIRMYASIEAVIHGPSLHVEKLYEDGSAKIDFARCSLLSLFSGSIDG